jgi:general secretion pathway protein K
MELRIRNPQSTIGNPEGIALLLVLWVMAILSVLALEFSFAMRTEINIAKNYKEELQLYALAKGGVERAVAELVFKHDRRVQQMRKTLKSEEIPPDKKEWVTDGRPYLLSSDLAVCELRIMSEAGKIDINVVSENTLRKVVGNLGLQGEARDIVVDSVMDWRDPDDFYRINGAENDYYQSLKEPYTCKNGNLDSIEELLLVRGVTPELFYGRKGTKNEEAGKGYPAGLKDLFSVYAQGEQIDINSASPIALRFVLGIPEDVSRLIVKAREEKGFESILDLRQRVPEFGLLPNAGEIERQLGTLSMTSYYTIESKAKNKEGGSNRGLKVIVKIDPREKKNYKIIQWLDRLY